MIKHQMDAARLNFSHGTYKEHAYYIKTIRAAAKELKRKILIIQDLSGPRTQRGKEHFFNKKSKSLITAKDKKDLRFGLENGIDYVAMSYVGGAEDIKSAKIERREAVKNIDAIIKSADAIMVARGDLGNAFPLEKLPFLQKMIIRKCKKAEKPVITATQMLLSMAENPEPTRAEVEDVAQAILDGSDAVMLSEETAIGKYPAEAVRVMERIVLESEKHERFKIHKL